MTVLLLGVGADSTNTQPIPPVYPDGLFEYIPIPERMGPEGTTESRTYGNTSLRHKDAAVADYVEAIYPRADEWTITDEELAHWPFHHDPNLEALTYGESATRPAYVARMRELTSGDLVAFYTGLRGANSRYTHRYLIGYFTIEEVIDFGDLTVDGVPAPFSALSSAQREQVVADHPDNAHAKRYAASGELAVEDGLIILDGREPGGRLEGAVRISEHAGGGQHYLRADLEDRWSPAPSGDPDTTAYLGGVKQAHRLEISSDEFVADIGQVG